jgi:hypothetical protein
VLAVQRSSIPELYFLLGLILPIILLFLPADFFDNRSSICLSALLLKKQCIGCGITRAVQHFLHFDFKTAWDYNHLVVLVFPLLIYLWIKELVTNYKKIKLKIKELS